MAGNYVAPARSLDGFHCPHCGVYAHQAWNAVNFGLARINEYRAARCSHCNDYSVWRLQRQVWPMVSTGPLPNEDLSDEIKAIYNEARDVFASSPRSAAALLRLCAQMLCVQLGKPGKNLNDDIRELVKTGLSPTVQQALAVLRVTGNNAVHPGQIDPDERRENAIELFSFLNLIADNLITQPRNIQEAYQRLPEGAIEQIQQRGDSPERS